MNPAEDIFDVVNEHDEIVDQQPRSVVHAQGLRHRAAHVLVFNEGGQAFLQLRSKLKDNYPGVWDNACSGHVDAGESYAVAAERELMEEIGLLVDNPLEELFKLEARLENGMEFVTVFMTDSEGPFELNAEEIDDGRWATPTEIQTALQTEPEKYSPTFRMIWERLAP
ncbi:MAG: NUDIX domain-containing protein [Verrucomicrobiota bacterium]|jgi:isopentenyl-diphosphate Delta-isomerase|nr:NUDIX domain-containing protein [Verrucomicrobiota bacterium]